MRWHVSTYIQRYGNNLYMSEDMHGSTVVVIWGASEIGHTLIEVKEINAALSSTLYMCRYIKHTSTFSWTIKFISFHLCSSDSHMCSLYIDHYRRLIQSFLKYLSYTDELNIHVSGLRDWMLSTDFYWTELQRKLFLI